MVDNEAPMRRMLEIIHRQPGISDDILRKEISTSFQLKEQLRVDLLLELQKQGFLRVSKNERNEVVYNY